MRKIRLPPLILIGCILLLTLPCSTWVLFRSYRTAIQIPRERADFENQEERILAAIVGYQTDYNFSPGHLTDLIPDYLSVSSLENGAWSFQYGRDRHDRFALSSDAPSRWFGWPTRRICRSDPERTVLCSYHYICGYKLGMAYLTDPISPDILRQNLFVVSQRNPCES